MKHKPLFESQHLRLTPIDPEKDAQAVASWTYELEIAARLREEQPARPMATFEVKKLYERWQKDADETNRQFLFAIRLRSDCAVPASAEAAGARRRVRTHPMRLSVSCASSTSNGCMVQPSWT